MQMRGRLGLSKVVIATMLLSGLSPLWLNPTAATTVVAQGSQVSQLKQQAQSQFNRGQIKEALQTYQQLLTLTKQQNDPVSEAQTLYKIGETYVQLRQFPQSIAAFEQALAIYRQIGSPIDAADTLNQIGSNYADLLNNGKAMASLLEALQILQDNINSGDGEHKLEVASENIYQLAHMYREFQQYAKARELFEQSLELLRKLPDSPAKRQKRQLRAGQILYLIGFMHYALNEKAPGDKAFQEATEILAPLLREYEQQGNKFAQGKLHLNLGSAYILWGKYAQSSSHLEKAVTIFRALDYPRLQGQSLYSLGNASYLNAFQQISFTNDTAKTAAALQTSLGYKQQAAELFQNSEDYGKVGEILLDLGNVYYGTLRHHPAALKSFEQALAIYEQLANAPQGKYYAPQLKIAKTLAQLAATYAGSGEYNQAIDFSTKALHLYEQQKQKTALTAVEAKEVADNLKVMGDAYTKLGKYPLALESLEESLQISQKVGYPAGQMDALRSLAAVYMALGQFDKARQLNEQASALIGEVFSRFNPYWDDNPSPAIDEDNFNNVIASFGQQTGNRALEAAALIGTGSEYRDAGEYEQALTSYQQARQIFRAVQDPDGEASALGLIGVIHLDLQQYEPALTAFEQALQIHRQLDNIAGQGSTLGLMGLAHSNAQQYLEAETTLFAALEAFESLRPGLKDENKVSIFEMQQSSYRLLQSVLVKQNKVEPALEVAERGRARAFVELLAQRLSQTSSEQITVKPPNIEAIKHIAQQQKATLVEYAIVSSQLYIWVVSPQGEVNLRQVDLKSLDLNLRQLVSRTRNFMRVRSRGNEGEQATASRSRKRINRLQQLHQILIEPIAQFLPQDPNERVIFIPQGELFLVPFPALQDADYQYLIEKHTILTAPAMQILQLTRQQKQRASGTEVLVVGNPTMPSIPSSDGKSSTQLSPLLGAEAEAQAIAQMLNTQALTGDQATEGVIRQKMSQAGIIHLATHGLLDDFGDGVPGAIALAPDSSTPQSNGLLTAGEIFNMQLKADLVVLSACDTGRGKITGDGVIGLSRSLIAAGTSSVVVSLWQVPDQPTAELMKEFYRQIKQNRDKAQALRQAMLATMKDYPMPRDWAAFTLMGEAE